MKKSFIAVYSLCERHVSFDIKVCIDRPNFSHEKVERSELFVVALPLLIELFIHNLYILSLDHLIYLTGSVVT